MNYQSFETESSGIDGFGSHATGGDDVVGDRRGWIGYHRRIANSDASNSFDVPVADRPDSTTVGSVVGRGDKNPADRHVERLSTDHA